MSERVELEYEHIRQRTGAAILVTIEDVDVWLPREFIEDWDEEDRTLTVPEWLAIDRGLV